MSGPFDIEPTTPDPKQRPSDLLGNTGKSAAPNVPQAPRSGVNMGNLNTGKASDLLKAPSGAPGGPSGLPGPGNNNYSSERRATKFDDSASGIFWIASLIFILSFGYMLYGMWMGSNPSWKAYTHDDHARIVSNIQLCSQAMEYSLIVATAAFLFLFYHEEYSGYVLLALALVLQLGLPYIQTFVFQATTRGVTDLTNQILVDMGAVSWITGAPGGLLIIRSIIDRIIYGLQNAREKRTQLRFGQGAVRDTKTNNVLMGPCWKLPFCREAVRVKCPIFLQKKGPCWRHKRGCMCDTSIQILAQAPNWKQNVASTLGKLETKQPLTMPEMPAQPQLSKAMKNERCRQCVIYNTHQEHKYKVLVAVTFAVCIGLLAMFQGPLTQFAGSAFMTANTFAGHLSFGSGAKPLFPNGAPPVVEWAMLGAALLVAISKALQFVEFCCFKLKI